jgi:hypothetical protein
VGCAKVEHDADVAFGYFKEAVIIYITESLVPSHAPASDSATVPFAAAAL